MTSCLRKTKLKGQSGFKSLPFFQRSLARFRASPSSAKKFRSLDRAENFGKTVLLYVNVFPRLNYPKLSVVHCSLCQIRHKLGWCSNSKKRRRGHGLSLLLLPPFFWCCWQSLDSKWVLQEWQLWAREGDTVQRSCFLHLSQASKVLWCSCFPVGRKIN